MNVWMNRARVWMVVAIGEAVLILFFGIAQLIYE